MAIAAKQPGPGLIHHSDRVFNMPLRIIAS
jgi:hypothetical protein